MGCDYEELTYTLVGRSVGVVVGAVGFGLINQRHQVRLTRQQSRVTVLVIFKNSYIGSAINIIFVVAHLIFWQNYYCYIIPRHISNTDAILLKRDVMPPVRLELHGRVDRL